MSIITSATGGIEHNIDNKIALVNRFRARWPHIKRLDADAKRLEVARKILVKHKRK